MQEGKQDSADAGKQPTGNAPKILIVDDQRFHLMTLHTLLRDRYQTMVAINGEQGIKAAVANQPDLVLLDVNMPGMDGHEVCRQLRENPATRHIPIIFITAMTDVTDEARGFELGAVDYIAKPFNHIIVKARVQTHIRLKRQTDLLEQYAFHDALTGLANRRAFDQRLELEWSRCQRNQSPLSLVMIDIDHFKLYNDRYGHGAGDTCLGEVGRVIMGEVRRASDLAARYGGEEFVLVLPDSDAERAATLAERVRQAVEVRALPHEASKVGPHVTLSIGVACQVPCNEWQPLDLMTAADQALYAAKSEGRNRVRTAPSNQNGDGG